MTMATDEAVACWAALVAFVEDVHAPQDQLTEAQWQAAERLQAAIAFPEPSIEDKVLNVALLVMLGKVDAPDLPEDEWAVAERMLTEYTALVKA